MDRILTVLAITLAVLSLIALIWVALTPRDTGAPTPAQRAARAAALAPSMHERLGPARLAELGDGLFRRMVTDPELQHHFAHLTPADLSRLRHRQTLVLGQLLGGPLAVDLRQLADIHRGLGVTHDAYWRAVGHLGAALSSRAVPRDIAVHLLSALYDLQDAIVDAPRSAATR